MVAPTRFKSGIVDRPITHPMGSLPFADPTKFFTFFDDFHSVTTAAAGVMGWHLDAVGSGSALAVSAGGVNGVATTETGNMADDNQCYQWAINTTPVAPFTLAAGKRAWLRVRFKTEDADKDKFYIGLHVVADDVLGTEPADQFVFRSGATPDAIQFAAGKTNSTEVTSGTDLGSMADDTFVTLTAYYDGVDSVYVWREDATGTVTHTSTLDVTTSVAGDLLPDAAMTPGFAIECTDTGADILSMDLFMATVER